MTTLANQKNGLVESEQATAGISQIPQPSIGKSKRNAALDFTKGMLVLIMVLYHWMNYFLGTSDNRYLRFLTPSFIFITGFLISNIYFAKYGVSDKDLPKRLFERGLKILATFAVLNIARYFLLARVYREQLLAQHSSFKSLFDIYIIGSDLGGGEEKTIAFFILIPIAYLLLLSVLLLFAARQYRYAFHVACGVCLFSSLFLWSRGHESANLGLITIGLLGVLLGYIPIEKIDAHIHHPYLIGLAYLSYLAAITAMNIIYPLQIIGVSLSLMIIYLLGNPNGEQGRVRNLFVLLGKYSLFGYIAQIAILQILRKGIGHKGPEMLMLPVSLLLATALTIGSVKAVHYLRSKSVAADKCYKAVFA